MSQTSLKQAFNDLFSAIDLCMGKRLHIPTLILIYSSIDIASWLHSENQSVKVRFTEWVDKYLLTGSSMRCTALDLYGARCGILHTFSSESDLSNAGKARQIYYAWAPSKVSEVEKLLAHEIEIRARLGMKPDDIVAVQVEDLLGGLRRGVDAFLCEVEADSVRTEQVHAKAEKFFLDLSDQSIADMIQSAETVLSKR